MPDATDSVDTAVQTVTQTGLTSVGLFALLVALTRWIGGNFAKEVTDLKTSIEGMKLESKTQMEILRVAREECEEKHETTREVLVETKVELASLKGRMTAIDGKTMFEVRSDNGEMHDKN